MMNNHLNGIRHYTSTFLTMKRSFEMWIGERYGTQRTSTQLNLMEKVCKRWNHSYTWSTSPMKERKRRYWQSKDSIPTVEEHMELKTTVC
ncbi:unnamed protein product [Schistosoma margrebowiei]|uniref:Uncharacterized protein n=1 Tax=Schistosoma margrebowiei TaxID=48269 RepID=A0A3P8D9H9_9TREM|nr:unnamed protein product [Schistosoma margrebowiei]